MWWPHKSQAWFLLTAHLHLEGPKELCPFLLPPMHPNLQPQLEVDGLAGSLQGKGCAQPLLTFLLITMDKWSNGILQGLKEGLHMAAYIPDYSQKKHPLLSWGALNTATTRQPCNISELFSRRRNIFCLDPTNLIRMTLLLMCHWRKNDPEEEDYVQGLPEPLVRIKITGNIKYISAYMPPSSVWNTAAYVTESKTTTWLQSVLSASLCTVATLQNRCRKSSLSGYSRISEAVFTPWEGVIIQEQRFLEVSPEVKATCKYCEQKFQAEISNFSILSGLFWVSSLSLQDFCVEC